MVNKEFITDIAIKLYIDLSSKLAENGNKEEFLNGLTIAVYEILYSTVDNVTEGVEWFSRVLYTLDERAHSPEFLNAVVDNISKD